MMRSELRETESSMNVQLHLQKVAKHWKVILQVSLGVLTLALAIFFIKHERTELSQVKTVLLEANPYWLLSGFLLVLFFVAVQGWMYQQSFRAVQQHIPFKVGMLLYLKRNFISVFIPAGTLTNLFFFNKDIEEKQDIEKAYIYSASTIFSICSITSSVLVAIPALILLFLKGDLNGEMVYGILGAVVVFGLLTYVVISIIKKGFFYNVILKRAPAMAKVVNDLQQQSLSRSHLLKVLLWSCVIELIGITHLYIAMGALGLTPSLIVAVIGYALVLIILLSSPFLRGIGAIELALTYALTLFSYTAVAALSVVFLFRFFEFWSVMLLGLFALLFKKDGLFMQLLVPVLLLFLGIVNILSALTPAIAERTKILNDFLSTDLIELSNAAVLVIGIILIITSIALIRGYKNAYYLALVLSIVSIVGHLFKGIDYEESIFASLTIAVLLYQRNTYFIKSIALRSFKWQNGLLLIASVLLYGIIGFYALDHRHFNVDFSLEQSILETLKIFVLIDGDLQPITSFGKYFLYSINMLGIASILNFVWLLYKSKKAVTLGVDSDIERAKEMVKLYGNSSMDYFKTYFDKKFYFFEDGNGFISYKTTKRYAVVLENLVVKESSNELLVKEIKEFDNAMLKLNLNTIYYRIPENSIGVYENLGKKKLLIGEDAYVNLETFTMEGGSCKALRNSVNKVAKAGYVFKVSEPPQSDAFIQQLAQVSNAWLVDMQRTELLFSQGSFIESELKMQTILTVQNSEGKIEAFINIIQGSNKDEINFDLMRKTVDAPNGAMDFLFVNMFLHFQGKGAKSICIGMVPLSGMENTHSVPEQAMNLAYEKSKQFSHYKSLRFFKEKFNPIWIKVYTFYDTDLDLVNLSIVLSKVMKENIKNEPEK